MFFMLAQAGFNAHSIIQLLIVLLVAGAIWYLFTLFAGKVGLPPIVVTVVSVILCVLLAVYALRFLGALL